MLRRVLALVTIAAVACSAVVVAIASTNASGLPAYTKGYQSWPKLNRKPIKGGSPAHSGVKNVYASKNRVRSKFPNGTVVVKSIAKPGDRPSTPTQVAVMRKLKGKWRYVEYELAGSRYSALALPQTLCSGCHMQAKATDYVFTTR
jgi:Cytochrome P460